MVTKSEITVRKARPEDEGRVFDLLRALMEDESGPLEHAGPTYQELVSGPMGEVLVAEEDGAVVGVITFSYATAIRYAGEYAQVEELIVDDSQRGKGTGALLVRAAIEDSRKRGCKEIGLYARETTRAFYEKLGFVYAGPEVRMALT